MCGPPDFAALETCVMRLAELSAAGLGTYAVCRTARLCRSLVRQPGWRQERTLQDTPARLAPEAPHVHTNP